MSLSVILKVYSLTVHLLPSGHLMPDPSQVPLRLAGPPFGFGEAIDWLEQESISVSPLWNKEHTTTTTTNNRIVYI